MAYKVGRCLLLPLLDKNKMSQQDLANELNVTVQQINKYVRNKQKMSIKVAGNIAFILRCHIEELYEWVEVGNNE